MNPYRRLIRRLGTTQWFAWFGRRVLTPLDKRLEGRNHSLTTLGTGFPMGYLTTKGRHTDESHMVPLLYVVPPEGTAAVVGTNFGDAHHPDWVYNLEAQPRARWKVDDEINVKARPATDLEFIALWPQFVDVWPGYSAYVERSGRQPRMFILNA